MPAIAFKKGQSPAEIEKSFGISRKNVYEWLARSEDRGLNEALYDGPKLSRPSKLSEEQFDKLETVLENSPEDVGYDVQPWGLNSSNTGSNPL